jgi:hypothetical protein
MIHDGLDDQFLNDEFAENFDPEGENWDNFSGDDDFPENIEWLDDIDEEDLNDLSLDDDLSELDLEDI